MKTTTELLNCAIRELSLREKVYPNLVHNRAMSQHKSDHEIECMSEIAKLLADKAETENPKLL